MRKGWLHGKGGGREQKLRVHNPTSRTGGVEHIKISKKVHWGHHSDSNEMSMKWVSKKVTHLDGDSERLLWLQCENRSGWGVGMHPEAGDRETGSYLRDVWQGSEPVRLEKSVRAPEGRQNLARLWTHPLGAERVVVDSSDWVKGAAAHQVGEHRQGAALALVWVTHIQILKSGIPNGWNEVARDVTGKTHAKKVDAITQNEGKSSLHWNRIFSTSWG